MRKEILAGYVLATWGMGIVVGLAMPARLTVAEDQTPLANPSPISKCAQCEQHEQSLEFDIKKFQCAEVEANVGLPLLNKIPYVSRLFQNCTPGVRVGIDFDVAHSEARPATPEYAQPFLLCDHLAQAAQGAANCHAAAQCEAACHQGAATFVHGMPHGAANLDEMQVPVKLHDLLGAVAEQAAAAAALEGHESVLAIAEKLYDERAETLSDVAELLAQKAKLEATVEYLTEREKWMHEMRELAVENMRLQAEVELAKQREDILRESRELAEENAQLRLELARAAQLEAAQTAKRAGAKRMR